MDHADVASRRARLWRDTNTARHCLWIRDRGSNYDGNDDDINVGNDDGEDDTRAARICSMLCEVRKTLWTYLRLDIR